MNDGVSSIAKNDFSLLALTLCRWRNRRVRYACRAPHRDHGHGDGGGNGRMGDGCGDGGVCAEGVMGEVCRNYSTAE